ncbi:MAG: type VI secretion system baseplate subunit TssK [Phycisphaerae bacterium]|nr:type VI secretion system baseplate subunit TssK [Phycisphaerae bacterium]
MSSTGQVHWHEGLFLQPHHLQMLERHQLDARSSDRRLLLSYPYGVVEARVATDALDKMQVKFDRLRAVMPSGLLVDYPENADLPELDVSRAFGEGASGFTVRLAVPIYQPAEANTMDQGQAQDARVRRLFRVAESARRDENTGSNEQAVLVRRINARLVLDGEPADRMETLAVLSIVRSTSGEKSRPQVDPRWAPPALVMTGAPVLRTLVRDLSNQVEASRQELVNRLKSGFSIENLKGLQFEQMLRLRVLNRFAGRLPNLWAAPGATPLEMYLELRELLSELAALYPDRDPFEAPRFDHDDPAKSFLDLDRAIRPLLVGAVAPKFRMVRLTPEGALMVGTFSDEDFKLATDFYLAITTKADPVGLARLVEDGDKFKLMPKSMGKMNVYGVRLQEERHPPPTLESPAGRYYFRLARADSQRMWDRVLAEKSIAVRWPEAERFDYSEMAVYMTVA